MDREAWNQRYSGEKLLWAAEPNRFLVEELSDLEPGAALDLACGEGRNAVWLAARGWEVDAVDFSDVALDKARRLAASRDVSVAWQLADLEDYRPAARRYDLVILFYLQLPWDRMRRARPHQPRRRIRWAQERGRALHARRGFRRAGRAGNPRGGPSPPAGGHRGRVVHRDRLPRPCATTRGMTRRTRRLGPAAIQSLIG